MPEQNVELVRRAAEAIKTAEAGLRDDVWCAVTLRDGKLTRTQTHRSRQEALEAVSEGHY